MRQIALTPTIRDYAAQGKVESLVEKSQRVLLKTSSVFPFDLFPDTIVVDENKLTIIKYYFFWTKTIYSVPINNIVSVEVASSPFFSTLNIDVMALEKDPEPVYFLWHADAHKIRRTVLGLIACDKEGIDTGEMSDTEVAEKVEKIGALHVP